MQGYAVISTHVVGLTHQGLPILAHRWPLGPKRVLILGGVHGDEIEGVWTAHALVEHFSTQPMDGLDLVVVPTLNLDGVLNRTRTNARSVDLNRNLPTDDWSAEVQSPRYHPGAYPGSELENQTLMALLAHQSPHLIVSLHSWRPCLNVNGDCEDEAKAFQRVVQCPIERDLGYPTPGCLGTYGATRLGTPVLTVELQRGGGSSMIGTWKKAVLQTLKAFGERRL